MTIIIWLSMVFEVSSAEAFNALKDNENALLVDVRTTAELVYVGGPDLSDCKAKLLFCPIYEFPHMDPNPDFENAVMDTIQKLNSEDIYFICRSGSRSATAARIFEEKGYKCCNIVDGFEGDVDEFGHRNAKGGWKMLELPWRQE